MSNQELIWVSKELKEAWDEAQSEEEQKKIFFKAIENKKLDIKCQIESLEDDVLLFKGLGIRYKTELEKIYNEQADHLEKLWEQFNAGDKIYKQAQKIEGSLRPILNTMQELNKSMSDVSTNKIEKLIEIIDKFNRMPDEDRQLLRVLIEYGNGNK